MKSVICGFDSHFAEHELLQLGQKPFPSDPLHVIRRVDVDGDVGEVTPATAVVRGFINLKDYVLILMKGSFI